MSDGIAIYFPLGWSVHEFEQSFRDKYEEPDTKETKEKS